MNLTTTYTQLFGARQALADHRKAAVKTDGDLSREIARLETLVAQSSLGLDVEMIAKAEAVIHVRGLFERAGAERGGARTDAIAQLVAGGGWLFDRYAGTKDYASWHGQRCDCTYGMGPSHGSIIFAIELQRSVRDARQLTPEQIEAAVYYLTHLEAIQRTSAPVAA